MVQKGQANFDGTFDTWSFTIHKELWENSLIRLSESINCTAKIEMGMLKITQIYHKRESIQWMVIGYEDVERGEFKVNG